MKMPSLKALHSHPASSPSQLFVADGRSTIWARSNTDDVSLAQLHKFWSELSSSARRELLRIDKQALFEQVRKNLYCSRCHGLLVEGYAQIVSYGKHLQAGLPGYGNGSGACKKHLADAGTNGANSSLQDDTRDPSVHPWGGLAATRDSMLTVLDCFLDGTPLEVFESARVRERERELLYPDACGGGGRGWISQSSGSFGGNGRGHGMKETCALHTARLSCEALVDFWSALGEETRRSLLRMKEEDFIERLMFRFDSKRFCRDCRRNVLREFKEMKELKRTRKEPRCTRWFCTADTTLRYEVSDSVVQVDWRECFGGDVSSMYQRFEWALGTAEGKADILGFEDVGLSESIQVEGLDLGNIADCYINVRGWKRDGRCSELSAKAHSLKGQLCVHRRLIVGDGHVSITKGESIQRFFERAEETEEEEDDESMDKDGNELDGEGSRPQKHAKSPELARDFLLDAATVIFKEQVEKAFREGTARQNAHSIFVCLSLSLLEERVRVACKEITTLEKQNKLLEEEEDERREEEERRERRKLKEKEKKLRRKEKLKGKEREKEKCKNEGKSLKSIANGSVSGVSVDNEDAEQGTGNQEEEYSRNDIDSISARPSSPDMAEARPSADGLDNGNGGGGGLHSSSWAHDIEDALSMRDGNGAFIVERTKSSKRRSQIRKPPDSEGSLRGQPNRDTMESVGRSRNPARVGSARSMEPCPPQDKITGLQGHTKNYVHRNEPENVSKRVDGWHHSKGHTQHRPEDLQHCACGAPQTNLRIKGSQRNITRVGTRDSPSSKIGERVDSGAKGLSTNAKYEWGYPQDKLDGAWGKAYAVPASKRKGERDQGKMDSDVLEATREGHCKTASAGELTGTKQNGGCMLANGAFPHNSFDNTASKSAWVTQNMTTLGSPVSRGISCMDRSTSLGKNKGIMKSTGRTRPSGATYHGKSSFVVSSTETAANELQQVGQVLDKAPGIRTSYGVQTALNPVSTGSRVSCVGSFATESEASLASDLSGQGATVPPSDGGVDLTEQPKFGVGSVKSDGETLLECFQTPVVLGTPGPTECAVPPRASTGSQGVPLAGIQSSGPTLVQNVLPTNEMLSSQGSIRTIQMPTKIPTPIKEQAQPGFGYFQDQGSWGAAHAINGVLPLPQPGGFLIPGLNSLGLSMAGLSPISLQQTGTGGVKIGQLSSLPNGLNTLQLRDSIFLSRFGGGPGCAYDGKTAIPNESQVLSPTSGLENAPVLLPCSDGLSLVLDTLPGTSFPSVQKENSNGSLPQADGAGFSLFHFSGPSSVAKKDLDSSSRVSLQKESTITDKGFEGLSNVPLNEIAGGSKDMCMAAGEYSLFATAGKGLVFF